MKRPPRSPDPKTGIFPYPLQSSYRASRSAVKSGLVDALEPETWFFQFRSQVLTKCGKAWWEARRDVACMYAQMAAPCQRSGLPSLVKTCDKWRKLRCRVLLLMMCATVSFASFRISWPYYWSMLRHLQQWFLRRSCYLQILWLCWLESWSCALCGGAGGVAFTYHTWKCAGDCPTVTIILRALCTLILSPADEDAAVAIHWHYQVIWHH